MKLLSRCENCKRRSWLIKARRVTLPGAGPACSDSLLCGRCARAIKKLVARIGNLQERINKNNESMTGGSI